MTVWSTALGGMSHLVGTVKLLPEGAAAVKDCVEGLTQVRR